MSVVYVFLGERVPGEPRCTAKPNARNRISIQTVPGMRFLVFESAVYLPTPRNTLQETTLSVQVVLRSTVSCIGFRGVHVCWAMSATVIAYGAICLRACYAMPGTVA
eukprot:690676-Rhodomonas_salina.1